MRFLLDHDVYAITARYFVTLGHDVRTVAQLGLAEADDEELLSVAKEQDRLLVTRDRDFGNLVFVRALGRGVIYLRILPSTRASVHEELARVLTIHSEEDLKRAFVVVEPGRHRLRRINR